MGDEDARLPAALWIEAHLRRLNAAGEAYYILRKGAYAGGMVLLKINGLENGCRLLVQQRGLDGAMGWMDALPGEGGDSGGVEEARADAYIERAAGRDPDLWGIEIEDRALGNPFEGKIIT